MSNESINKKTVSCNNWKSVDHDNLTPISACSRLQEKMYGNVT